MFLQGLYPFLVLLYHTLPFIPGFCSRFDKPDDGLPCVDDWVGTFESMLFGGIDLGREPLDGSMQMLGGGRVGKPLGCFLPYGENFQVFCCCCCCRHNVGLASGTLAGSWPANPASVDQVKGWTRSSIVLTILVAASEKDVTDNMELLKPLAPVLEKCWMIPVHVSLFD